MRIRWLLKAVYDLEDLHEYIALDNPTAASGQVKIILKAVKRIVKIRISDALGE